MKKIFYILIIPILCLTITGCSDDNDNIASSLEVITADVSYTALGGTGKIIVSSDKAIKASSDKDWCTVNVSGSEITVTVAPVESLDTRNAYVTISSTDTYTSVVITQSGAISYVEVKETPDLPLLGGSVSFPIKSEVPITITIAEDWLTYVVENGELTLTAKPGEKARSTTVTIESQYAEGVKKQTFTVDQKKLSYIHFLGDWEYEYTDPSNSSVRVKVPVKLTEKVSDFSYNMEGLVVTGSTTCNIELGYNQATNNVTADCGQYLVAVGSRYIFLCLRSATGGYTWSADFQLDGIFKLASDNTVTYTFVDPSGVYSGLGFYGFTTNPASGSGSYYKRMMDIVMTKK